MVKFIVLLKRHPGLSLKEFTGHTNLEKGHRSAVRVNVQLNCRALAPNVSPAMTG